MKKALLLPVLICALLGALSAYALAAEAGGYCLIGFENSLPALRSDGTAVMVPSDGTGDPENPALPAALSMLDSNGNAVEGAVDSDGNLSYRNAVKIRLVLSDAEADASYLLTVQNEVDAPKENNLTYIAQKKTASDGTVDFTFNPSAAGFAQTYYIYLSSNAVGETALKDRTIVAEFRLLEADAPSFMPGDLNGDGHIYANDAVPILREAAGLDAELTEAQRLAADVNGDGYIYANDAVPVLKVAAGLFETIEEAIAG